MTKFSVILADPPWSFRDKCNSGRRGACHKYETMTIDEVKALRPNIDGLAAPDCALFLWVPSPLVVQGVVGDVMRAWNFRPVTEVFRWVKTRADGLPAFGMGHWSRANSEGCYIGLRGRPKRVNASVRQTLLSPRREHSRKPDEIYGLIEQLIGNVPRVELFARQRWPGWAQSLSNQTNKFTPPTAA